MEVTTLINLLQLVETVAEKEMGSEAIPFTEDAFHTIVEKVYKYFDPFSKWAPSLDKG
jgi:hypothetical protein